jgi:N-acyl-D-amino-acid deacylase
VEEVAVELDITVRGGDVLDGTGSPARRLDIGIRDGRITALGDLTAAASAQVVEAAGRTVTPGFIDVHAHTDVAGLLDDEHVDIKLAGARQGVTTEVCGNCGFSTFPAASEQVDPADPRLALIPGSRRFYRSLADYRTVMAEVPLAANLAPLVGHGRIRSVALGGENRSPTSDELEHMQRLTAEAMDDGAFGLSSGLVYAPAVYAQTEELVALAEVVGRYGRPYTTHMRNESDHVEEAVAEALRIGREAGTSVEISHHKIAGKHNWGRSHATLAAIEVARRTGLDVTLDVYPYTAGCTYLAGFLPPWVSEGGPTHTLERLRDSAARERIAHDFASGLPGWQNLSEITGWHNVVVAGEPPRAGCSIQALADDEGRAPSDYVVDLILEDPQTLVIIHMMDEHEVNTISDQPFALTGSDGVPVPGSQHPRLAGTFARVVGRHASDANRLADVIRRMTSLPARRFNLGDRGIITEGAIADLVVFDPTTVSDRATYEQPLLPPTGIDHVIIAGELVIDRRADTGRRPGRVLEPA